MKLPVPLILLIVASIDAAANRAARRKSVDLQDRYLTVAEAADYLGVTTKSIRNMLADKRLPAYTLGFRVLRIRLSDIESALTPYGGEHGTS